MMQNINKIKINKAFNFWHQIVDWVNEDKERLYEIDLTGSRWSGKTISILIFCAMLIATSNLRINAFFFRLEPNGARQSWKEFLGVCRMLNIETSNKNGFNHTEREWTYKNSRIRFLGFKSNTNKEVQKLGLARGIGREVVIRVIDEIFEFRHPTMVSIIDQAVGGAKQILKINSSNPWSILHWYVEKINNFHPYSKSKMKAKGVSTKSIWISDKHFKLSSQTNHRVNEFLNYIEHQELINLWKLDPFQAQIADLGIPGITRGSIYGRMMHKIKDPKLIRKNNKNTIFEGGVDWGESDNIGGSGTFFVFGRADRYDKWETADFEYEHRNSTSIVTKTQDRLVKELINTYVVNFYKEYDYDFFVAQGGANIYVDSAAVGMPNLLKAELMRQDPKLAKFTEFLYCVKWTRDERVKVKKYQMSKGELYIDIQKCPELFKQYQNLMYDEDKLPDEEVPVKEADDGPDAMDYKSCRRTRDITAARTFKIMYGNRRNIWR